MKIPFRTMLLQAFITTLMATITFFLIAFIIDYSIESNQELIKYDKSNAAYFVVEGTNEAIPNKSYDFKLLVKDSSGKIDENYTGIIEISGDTFSSQYVITKDHKGIFPFSLTFSPEVPQIEKVSIFDIKDLRLSTIFAISVIEPVKAN